MKSCLTCIYAKVRITQYNEEPPYYGFTCNFPFYKFKPNSSIKRRSPDFYMSAHSESSLPDPECKTCYGKGITDYGSEGHGECYCFPEEGEEVVAEYWAAKCPSYVLRN